MTRHALLSTGYECFMTCTLEKTCAMGLMAIRLTSLPPRGPGPHGRGFGATLRKT